MASWDFASMVAGDLQSSSSSGGGADAALLTLLRNPGLLRVSQSATPPGAQLRPISGSGSGSAAGASGVQVWGRQLDDQTVAFAVLNLGANSTRREGAPASARASATVHFDVLR